MTEPVKNPAAGGSLLERAARVYDFNAFLRPAESVNDLHPPRPGNDVAPDPVQDVAPEPVVERVPEPADDCLAEPAGEATIEPSLAAIPVEFLAAGDHDDFVPPPADPTVAAIDRALLAERGMIVPGAPIGPLAEEFRLVKRHLLGLKRLIAESDRAERARTILVCSARPEDGKTSCAINLALSIAAERDTEVLLVDADFAKPDVCRQLGVQDGRGLLDALEDFGVDPETLVIRTDVPGLSVLPAGTRTTADTELLASVRTRHVLSRLLEAEPKRVILFDSPPALAASPAAVLATLVGQVLLVVRADRTADSELREAVGLLDGCEHIELLLNAVSFTPGGHRFGSYYGQEGPK